MFDKVRNDLNYQWFYSELKTSQCLTLHLLFSHRECSYCIKKVSDSSEPY
ncbi:hypothetical protein HTS61_07100 [Escherichia coli]|nr:hypothetical protein [Escherichia coli]